MKQRSSGEVMEKAAAIKARQIALIFALSFASFCLLAQMVRAFLI
jgi:hypothetical protein